MLLASAEVLEAEEAAGGTAVASTGFGLRGRVGDCERAVAGEALRLALFVEGFDGGAAAVAVGSLSTSIAESSASPFVVVDVDAALVAVAAAAAAAPFFFSPLAVRGRLPSLPSSRSLPFRFPFGISFSFPFPLSLDVGAREGAGVGAEAAGAGTSVAAAGGGAGGAAAGGVEDDATGRYFGSGGSGSALGMG